MIYFLNENYQNYSKIIFTFLSILANLALTAGIVLHLITYFLPQIIIQNKKYPTMAVGKKIGLALLPNSCIQ